MTITTPGYRPARFASVLLLMATLHGVDLDFYPARVEVSGAPDAVAAFVALIVTDRRFRVVAVGEA